MSLQEELQRIADRAPVADVPADTWARARRARRRDVALTLAGAAAAIALVAGLVAWLPARLDPPVADTDSIGVPAHLYGVPDRFTARNNDDTWMRREVEDDVRVGRGAAAWLAADELPVVVDAESGDYHLLDLPDFAGNNSLTARGLASPTVALSPDGSLLAYSYAYFGPHAADEPIPSGIRVVDLETGRFREVIAVGDEGTAVSRIAWSPDGSWLAFAGLQLGSWTKASMGGGHPVVGRVSPTAERATMHRISDHESVVVTVTDEGLVRVVGNGRRVRWDGRSWSGSDLPGGAYVSGPGVNTSAGVAAGAGDGLTVEVVADTGRPTTLAAAGDLPASGGGETTVLGTSGTDLVVRTRSLDDTAGQLLLISARGDDRVVGTVDAGVAASLSLATDLISEEHPTVARPEPDWPLAPEQLAVRVALSAGAALLLALLATGLVRRYRSAR